MMRVSRSKSSQDIATPMDANRDAKGAVDLEVNVGTARQVYEEARDLARKRGDKAREARAVGELGIIAFMQGETGRSLELLSDALRTSIELKDVGAHIRYLNLMGNGLTRLQAKGHRVAMAGDGVNNAPALAQAEV